jgi:hypothetical protein
MVFEVLAQHCATFFAFAFSTSIFLFTRLFIHQFLMVMNFYLYRYFEVIQTFSIPAMALITAPAGILLSGYCKTGYFGISFGIGS